MNLIYTPDRSKSYTIDCLHTEHVWPQTKLASEVYTVIRHQRENPSSQLAVGHGIALMLGNRNPGMVAFTINRDHLLLADVWGVHALALASYLTELSVVCKNIVMQQRRNRKVIDHLALILGSVESWVTHECGLTESARRIMLDTFFPWPKDHPVYAAHRQYLNLRQGYNLEGDPLPADKSIAECLWPAPKRQTRLKPRPSFERLLARIRTDL